MKPQKSFPGKRSTEKSGTKPLKGSSAKTTRSHSTQGTDPSKKPKVRPAISSTKKGKINFYKPKTFKGAHSREEEIQLAEGTIQRIALEILNHFEETNDRIDHLLQEAIHKHAKLLGFREKANLVKTMHNVIRWKLKIDYIVSKSLKMNSDSLDLTLKNAYRLATLNIIWLNKSVTQAISLSDFAIPKEFGKFKETVRLYIKFLHKAQHEIPYPNPEKNLVNALSIIHSHPVWLIDKWIAAYGKEKTVALCEFNNSEPPLTIRTNTIKTSTKELIHRLEREGFEASACPYAKEGLNLNGKGEIFALSAFKEGAFEIQDESSQLFAAWCDPHPDHVIIDACAGSGGKSLFFSALMRNRGKILASDKNKRVLEKLRKRAVRAGSSNIEICDLNETATAANWLGKADKVIVDAPCSGLGTLARNPDIKWRFDHNSFAALAAEQISLLAYFASFVKPGGELIYGTCTLNPDENEHIIRHFLNTDDRLAIVKNHSEPFARFIDEGGFFYIKPFEHKLGGFFGCKLVKNK